MKMSGSSSGDVWLRCRRLGVNDLAHQALQGNDTTDGQLSAMHTTFTARKHTVWMVSNGFNVHLTKLNWNTHLGCFFSVINKES